MDDRQVGGRRRPPRGIRGNSDPAHLLHDAFGSQSFGSIEYGGWSADREGLLRHRLRGVVRDCELGDAGRRFDAERPRRLVHAAAVLRQAAGRGGPPGRAGRDALPAQGQGNEPIHVLGYNRPHRGTMPALGGPARPGRLGWKRRHRRSAPRRSESGGGGRRDALRPGRRVSLVLGRRRLELDGERGTPANHVGRLPDSDRRRNEVRSASEGSVVGAPVTEVATGRPLRHRSPGAGACRGGFGGRISHSSPGCSRSLRLAPCRRQARCRARGSSTG